mmetsp:Transcript_63288/g.137684  ORF Transcript_63288/g.137684 Transcript_63288/m.137684 type:complete len:325 (+) Transcript_63288:2007-2981(+)
MRSFSLDDDVRLKEPLLINEASEPQHTSDIGRRDRTIWIDPCPVVQHRAAVVYHWRPLEFVAKREKRLSDVHWQGFCRLLFLPTYGIVGISQITIAIGHDAATPVGQHHVAHNPEGTLELLRVQLVQSRLATETQTTLQFLILVEVSVKFTADTQSRKQIYEIGKGLPGGAIQCLYANGIATREEPVLPDAPQVSAVLHRTTPGAVAANEFCLARVREGLRLRDGWPFHQDSLVHLPQVSLCNRRVTHRPERLSDVLAREGKQEWFPTGMVLEPPRHVIDLAAKDHPDVFVVGVLSHLCARDPYLTIVQRLLLFHRVHVHVHGI